MLALILGGRYDAIMKTPEKVFWGLVAVAAIFLVVSGSIPSTFSAQNNVNALPAGMCGMGCGCGGGTVQP